MRNSILVLFAVAALIAAPSFAGQRANPAHNGTPWTGSLEQGDDDCPGTPIGALPYTDSGTTCGYANNLGGWGASGTCTLPAGAQYYNGEDVVYQITVAAGNDLTFDMPAFAGDLVLALFSVCGDGNSCVIASADSIGPGALPETIQIAGLTAGTYYLYVDSYYAAGTANSCGTYTLNVTGTVPAEMVSFTAE
jgi:hypothetical protein